MKKPLLILHTVFLLALSACSLQNVIKPVQTSTSTKTAIEPRAGQPSFPALGQYWVVDKGCNFDLEIIKTADQIFEKLRTDGIAEVAVICQTGIQDNGATNNEKIWLRDWGRWAQMGDVEENRAVIWLIRPDVKPEEGRITIELSRWLTWYTAVDYMDTLGEAANYANWNNFNGALESLTRNTDSQLRHLWQTHQE